MSDNKNSGIIALVASPDPSNVLAEQFVAKIEKYHILKRNWEEATKLREKNLKRKTESYKSFRKGLVNQLTGLLEAERNGWVKMEDGPPPVGAQVQLWFTDNDGEPSICMQASLSDPKHTVMQAVAVAGEIEFKNIMYWKLITIPGGNAVMPIDINVVSDEDFDIPEDEIPLDQGQAIG